MKTLKQLIANLHGKIVADEIIPIVKEWLTQKRPNTQRCDNSDCPECQAKNVEDDLINELLMNF